MKQTFPKSVARFLALWLCMTLTLPNPSFAMRAQGVDDPQGAARSGLEEHLKEGDPVPPASLQNAPPATAGLEEVQFSQGGVDWYEPKLTLAIFDAYRSIPGEETRLAERLSSGKYKLVAVAPPLSTSPEELKWITWRGPQPDDLHRVEILKDWAREILKAVRDGINPKSFQGRQWVLHLVEADSEKGPTLVFLPRLAGGLEEPLPETIAELLEGLVLPENYAQRWVGWTKLSLERGNGITTTEQLLSMSREEVERLPNLDPPALEVIRLALGRYNQRLRTRKEMVEGLSTSPASTGVEEQRAQFALPVEFEEEFRRVLAGEIGTHPAVVWGVNFLTGLIGSDKGVQRAMENHQLGYMALLKSDFQAARMYFSPAHSGWQDINFYLLERQEQTGDAVEREGLGWVLGVLGAARDNALYGKNYATPRRPIIELDGLEEPTPAGLEERAVVGETTGRTTGRLISVAVENRVLILGPGAIGVLSAASRLVPTDASAIPVVVIVENARQAERVKAWALELTLLSVEVIDASLPPYNGDVDEALRLLSRYYASERGMTPIVARTLQDLPEIARFLGVPEPEIPAWVAGLEVLQDLERHNL